MVNFDSPCSRSRKRIGISTIFLHRHRTMSSNPILYPVGFKYLARSKVVLGKAKNPDIGSEHFVSGFANAVAPKLIILLTNGQFSDVTPPPTFLDPTAKSASPLSTELSSSGTLSGFLINAVSACVIVCVCVTCVTMRLIRHFFCYNKFPNVN